MNSSSPEPVHYLKKFSEITKINDNITNIEKIIFTKNSYTGYPNIRITNQLLFCNLNVLNVFLNRQHLLCQKRKPESLAEALLLLEKMNTRLSEKDQKIREQQAEIKILNEKLAVKRAREFAAKTEFLNCWVHARRGFADAVKATKYECIMFYSLPY